MVVNVFFSTLLANHKKLDPKAKKGVYLGHRNGVKGYLVYNLQNRNIIVTRNIIFHKHIFPFKISCDQPNSQITPQHDQSVSSFAPTLDFYDNLPHYPTLVNLDSPHTTTAPASAQPDSLLIPADSPITSIANPQPPLSQPISPTVIRKSTRTRKPPSYLRDYHCTLASTSSAIKLSSRVLSPISKHLSYDKLSYQHRNYILNLFLIEEPKSYSQAVLSED